MASISSVPFNQECAFTNMAGVSYYEFTCLYPALGTVYTSFEKNRFDPVPNRDWMVAHPALPVMACLLYGILIVFGRSYFETKAPWDWRRLMALWNLGLSLFSAVGFSRTLPQLLHNMYYYSVEENLCSDPEFFYGSGSTGLWVQLFILSKFPELMDTFFIVIHKKKLIFLHWYHHITVLLYCWHSYVTKTPSGLYFCVMNYGVHSVMYFYYFLMAIKIRPPWAVLVTSLQISQMMVGVVLTILGFLFVGRPNCWIGHDNNMAAFLMYGSYLFLFLQFFVGRYFVKSQRKIIKKA